VKVLIADDNASVRRVLEAMLAAWGYTVVSATDGREAWQIMERHDAPPLAVIDWMMPGMDGIDICRGLRAEPSQFRPYLILLTCKDQQEDIVTGLEAGADDYVTKPFETEELRVRLLVGKRYVEMQSTLKERMSELHRQGEELRRSNRALKLLNESSRLLTSCTNEQELLESICREMVDTAGYRLAWIGLTEDSAPPRLRPVAQAGFEDGALDAMRMAWNDATLAKSPAGKAIQTGSPVIMHDIAGNPSYTHRQVEAAARGFASLIIIPFTVTPGKQGTLSIYARERNAFDPREVRLLAELAESLAYSINALRTANERRRIEEELQTEHATTQLYLDVAGVLIVALDRNGTVTLVNAKGCATLGYQQEEILGKNWFELCSPESEHLSRKAVYEELMTEKRPFHEFFESTILNSGRSERVLAVHASLLRDRQEKITGMLFSGEDVTERKITEKALRKSEANYRTLFDRMVNSSQAIAAYRSGGEET
jgi:PAS domain S-box-containing protein